MITREFIEQQMEARRLEFLRYHEAPYACRLLPELMGFDEERREITLSFDVDESMTNASGSMHGGLIAMAFDGAMSLWARCYADGVQGTTTGIQVNYLRPVKLPGRLIVRSVCAFRGRTLTSLTAEAWNEGEEKTAATAMATFYRKG